ncbi:hypothetical protein [Vagococcus carniphilus]
MPENDYVVVDLFAISRIFMKKLQAVFNLIFYESNKLYVVI